MDSHNKFTLKKLDFLVSSDRFPFRKLAFLSRFFFEKLNSDIIYEIRQIIIFKLMYKQQLKDAVILYDKNLEQSLRLRSDNSRQKYGDISLWDTFLITDMSRLFYNMDNFNVNISRWNTTNVINMQEMFENADDKVVALKRKLQSTSCVEYS